MADSYKDRKKSFEYHITPISNHLNFQFQIAWLFFWIHYGWKRPPPPCAVHTLSLGESAVWDGHVRVSMGFVGLRGQQFLYKWTSRCQHDKNMDYRLQLGTSKRNRHMKIQPIKPLIANPLSYGLMKNIKNCTCLHFKIMANKLLTNSFDTCLPCEGIRHDVVCFVFPRFFLPGTEWYGWGFSRQ